MSLPEETMHDKQLKEAIKNPVAKAVLRAGSHKLVYVFSHPGIPYHEGRVKVGEATVHLGERNVKDIPSDELQKLLDEAAHHRIKQYHSTGDVIYKLEHAELAVREVLEAASSGDRNSTKLESFSDYDIHALLQRSGFKKTFAREDKNSGEWFEIDVATAKAAIAAYKNRKDYVGVSKHRVEFKLRPEQERAVDQTFKAFRNASIASPVTMLWNAKMRFGKTLSTYAFVKYWEQEAEKLAAKANVKNPLAFPKKILILTHKPLDTADSWSTDFKKFGMPAMGWRFGSDRGGSDVTWREIANSDKFFYFASVQNLRGSFGETLDEEEYFKKNRELFATEWDLVVSDEAHVGLTTALAQRVFKELKSARNLDLSGTPFNIIQAEGWDDEDLAARFAYGDNIYSWSYPDERKAKIKWDLENPLEPNPYASLPEVKFITYDVSKAVPLLAEDDNASISFKELFAVTYHDKDKNRIPATFVHEDQVMALLKKMKGWDMEEEDAGLFPFHRNWDGNFNHTLWMLPNVAAAEAMELLLTRSDSPFFGFTVVNATGRGAESWVEATALAEVKKAIATQTHTITLSYQMLTAGVTVPEWTGVFMLNNVSDPKVYMQTAFRAASPGSLADGRAKEAAYVFDFNPNRCLREIVEIAKFNAAVSKDNDQEEQDRLDDEAVREYLSFISVLAMKGARFIEPDSTFIMEQLNEVYVNEIISKGFDSPLLWNNRELRHFDIQKARILEKLRQLGGGKVGDKGTVNPAKLSEEDKQTILDHRKQERDSKKKDATGEPLAEPLTPEKAEELRKLEAKNKDDAKNRQNAVKVLAGLAARFPMLVLAASIADETLSDVDWMSEFVASIDDESWREFMPKNLLRVMPEGTLPLEERQEQALGNEGNVLYWDDVKRFFESKMFTMASKRMRDMTREADAKEPIERAVRMAAIIARWKNPDKETVLTPFRVVQMQYLSTLGGLQILDLDNSTASNSLVLMKSLETNESESLSLQKAVQALDAGTHMLAPVWVDEPYALSSSELEEVEAHGAPESELSTADAQSPAAREGMASPLWTGSSTFFDINSKTALYPLQAAISLQWQAERDEEINEYLTDGADAEEALLRKREIWEEIIKHCIFVNSRVAYSKLIAQRVLVGFEKKSEAGDTLEPVRVNASVVDVIELRKKINVLRDEGWKILKGRDYIALELKKLDKDGKVKFESDWKASFESNLYRWVFNPKSVRAITDSSNSVGIDESSEIAVFDNIDSVAEARVRQLSLFATAFRLLKEQTKEFKESDGEYTAEEKDIVAGMTENMAVSLEKLSKEVEASVSESDKFDAIVGNPPYQKSENGKNSDIWPDFIEVSSSLSFSGSFIHPARWVIPKKNMIKTQDFLIEKGLSYFSYLAISPFPGIDIDGNVSITLFTFEKKAKRIYFQTDFEKLKVWNRSKTFFSNKYEQELYKTFESLLKQGSMSDTLVGVLAAQSGQDFGYRKLDQLKFLSKSSKNMKKPIKIWANPSFGKGTRFEWFYIDERNLEKTSDYIKAVSSRKVMIDKKGHSPSYLSKRGNVFNNSAEIVEKHVVGSEKVFLMPIHDTDRDLNLIASLMMTRTARALMSITQKDLYVRGFENIPLYTILASLLEADGEEIFTDKWFYKHFSFSQELIKYIEDHISVK